MARRLPLLLPAAVVAMAWLAWRWRAAAKTAEGADHPPHDNPADLRALARETGRMADA